MDPEALATKPVCATALRALIEQDREAGRPLLRFGIVFPYSTRDLELRCWLASAGIDPERDIALRTARRRPTSGCRRRSWTRR